MIDNVPQEGLEPPTFPLGRDCSVQLSYWGNLNINYISRSPPLQSGWRSSDIGQPSLLANLTYTTDGKAMLLYIRAPILAQLIYIKYAVDSSLWSVDLSYRQSEALYCSGT